MKVFSLAWTGALSALLVACHINVDEACDDDDGWGDDDDEQPCETHLHADTSSTTGGEVTSGSGGSSSAGSTGSQAAAGGSGGAGSDSGSTGSGGTESGTAGSAGESGADGACADCQVRPGPSACLWGTTVMDACCTAEVLADAAAAGCADYGLVLEDIVLEDACAEGHQQVSYQCCLAEPASCSLREISLDSCVGAGVLEALAEELCAEQDREVVDVTLADGCDTGARAAIVNCCAE